MPFNSDAKRATSPRPRPCVATLVRRTIWTAASVRVFAPVQIQWRLTSGLLPS